MFSGTNYVKTASPINILLSIPLIFFWLNNQTLGIISYSPILGLLIPPFIKSLRDGKFSTLTRFDRFMLTFGLTVFLIYLPFVNSGVVETGVRDYRFYLPLFIPLFYFISGRLNIKPSLVQFRHYCPSLRSRNNNSSNFVSRKHLNLTYVYLALSTAFLLIFLFYDRLDDKVKSEILPLAMLPLILLVADRTMGYFSPMTSTSASPCWTGWWSS